MWKVKTDAYIRFGILSISTQYALTERLAFNKSLIFSIHQVIFGAIHFVACEKWVLILESSEIPRFFSLIVPLKF